MGPIDSSHPIQVAENEYAVAVNSRGIAIPKLITAASVKPSLLLDMS